MTGTLDCTPKDQVDASADIPGNGVLAAFLLSPLLTLGAVVFGYFTESLPEGHLNEIDRTLIDRMHFTQTLDSLRSRLAHWKDKALFRKQPSPRQRKLRRDERQEALTRFIPALSDQQLATGFAVLIGAVANQRSLTAYDFRIAFGLAWFSRTTHLATLDVLRDYFIVHATVRRWRICGMVLILLLLFYCEFMTWASPEDTVPIQCLYDGPNNVVVTDTNNATRIVPGHNFNDPISSLGVLTPFAMLATGYITRINWSRGRSANHFLLERIIFRQRYRPRDFPQLLQMNAVTRTLLFREFKAAQRSTRKRRLLEQAGTYQGFRRAFYVYLHIMDRYDESFLSLVPPLMFMISYGFTQLVVTRWMYPLPIIVDGGVGFGQITALCLLIVPFLAASEIYYEAKTDDTTEGSQNEATTEETAPSLVSPTGPVRADTIPVTLPTDDDEIQALYEREHDYNKVRDSIRVYFYAEVHEIENTWRSADPAIELLPILQKKHSLLCKYQILEAFEKSLPVKSHTLIPFALNSALCITMGILLNFSSQSGTNEIIGSTMLLLYYAGSVANFYSYLVLVFQAMDRDSIMQAYARIQRDSTAADSSSSETVVASGAGPVTPLGDVASQPASSSALESYAMQDFSQVS